MAEVLLFSYGTLQDPAVQVANFGRPLDGTPDVLSGYEIGEIEITDPEVIAESGLTHHRIIRPTTDPAAAIPGVVLRIIEDDLSAADVYEAEDYVRVRVRLGSGLEAWVYVAADAVTPS